MKNGNTVGALPIYIDTHSYFFSLFELRKIDNGHA